jgi:hypothetical protein
MAILIERGRVADRENLRMIRHGKIALNAQAAGTISCSSQPLAHRRRCDARGPNHGLAEDPLAGNDYSIGVDLIDRMP